LVIRLDVGGLKGVESEEEEFAVVEDEDVTDGVHGAGVREGFLDGLGEGFSGGVVDGLIDLGRDLVEGEKLGGGGGEFVVFGELFKAVAVEVIDLLPEDVEAVGHFLDGFFFLSLEGGEGGVTCGFFLVGFFSILGCGGLSREWSGGVDVGELGLRLCFVVALVELPVGFDFFLGGLDFSFLGGALVFEEAEGDFLEVAVEHVVEDVAIEGDAGAEDFAGFFEGDDFTDEFVEVGDAHAVVGEAVFDKAVVEGAVEFAVGGEDAFGFDVVLDGFF